MYNLMDSDQPIIAAIYCVSLILLGSLFLLNLILVVVVKVFLNIYETEVKQQAEKFKQEEASTKQKMKEMKENEDSLLYEV